jgi:YebC/PmpR family DNA-binding regulatory protein
MSGHSKWHNIKLRKQAQDARKSKLFGKITREIITAARAGGGDRGSNNRLRIAVEKARGAGMPQDNIKRAIQRGTGEAGGAQFESVAYEGYGPGGVAVMVHALTDNRNRIVSEIRSVFSRHGGNLGETNCVAWLFSQKGVIIVPRANASEERVLELALEAGAEDVLSDESSYEIRSAPGDLDAVKHVLDQAGIGYETAEVTMLPQTRVMLDEKHAQQMLRLMDALDELEDVQQVYANFDISERLMEAMAA